jgi:tRNA(fMet)-specific endonuclease VapC
MKKCMLDTNIVSAILKGNERVITYAENYLKNDGAFIINAITYYEIKRGLLILGSKRKIIPFEEFISTCEFICPDKAIFERAAQIYATLSNEGQIIEDADILIAASVLENELTLITDNEKHFARIKGLTLENWIRR